MTSAYRHLDRADLRSVLERGPFARRPDGYGIAFDALGFAERDEELSCAWGDADGELEAVRAALAHDDVLQVAAHGRLRFDSGAHATPIEAWRRAAQAFDEVASRLDGWGMTLVACGANPWFASPSPLELVLRLPFGSPASAPARWSAAHKLAPLSEAIFACSPMRDGATPGLRSTAAAERLEQAHASAAARDGAAPLEQFLDWALDARPNPASAGAASASFRAWMQFGSSGGYPDAADFAAHARTLRASVLPDGAICVRAADAASRAFLCVPLLWWSVLLDDAGCLREIGAWEQPTRSARELAVRTGLADPLFAARAKATFAWAADRLLARPGVYADAPMLAAFIAFGQRFALRGRASADEWLSRFARRGEFRLADYRAMENDWMGLCGVRRAA